MLGYDPEIDISCEHDSVLSFILGSVGKVRQTLVEQSDVWICCLFVVVVFFYITSHVGSLNSEPLVTGHSGTFYSFYCC